MTNELKYKNLTLKVMDIDDLKPYQNNPRNITQTAINAVKKSISENEFNSVIVVDKNLEIIAGHTRVLAAKALGYKELPVMISNIDDLQAKKLRLLDNRLTELTEWDAEKLLIESLDFDQDEDYQAMFAPLLEEDLSEFDLSDDDYIDNETTYNNAIIQYVLIFDDEKQQSDWYTFIAKLKEQYPQCETHASRLHQHIKQVTKL